MNVGWLEIGSGLGGDMFLGAILDAGWEEERLREGIAALGLGGFRLTVERRGHHGITGLGVRVEADGPEPSHRHFTEIRGLLESAPLPEPVRLGSIGAFRLIAEAEARVHGVAVDEVHFHEVGAYDSIVDIVGTILGLHELGIGRLTATPVPIAGGEVRIGHGTVSAPAPATAILLEGWPVRPDEAMGEFVTPTAAALLRIAATPGGGIPRMRVRRVGYGAGTREHPRLPNLVRLWVGETEAGEEAAPCAIEGATFGQVAVLETQVDDMDPRFLARLTEELLEEGALDVFRTPLLMKKGRQGSLLGVVARPPDADRLAGWILSRSTTLGVRVRLDGRWEAEREVRVHETSFGPIGVKWRGRGERRLPTLEYEELARISRATGQSIGEIEYRILGEIRPQE